MMQFPVARRSKYSEYYVNNGLVDYNIIAPINEGYSFPCKGFPKGPSTTTINGNTINVELQGSAIHGGGHCQFGITTNDKEFIVLNTVIKNCLLGGMTYSFQLPSDFPETDITVFWTWVNAIGNREYYMDCADVTIKNGNKNKQATVEGLELLVLNWPGYTTIPEFPNPGMYDGSELFDTRKKTSMNVITQQPKVEVQKEQVKQELKVEAPKVEVPKEQVKQEPKVEVPKEQVKQEFKVEVSKEQVKQEIKLETPKEQVKQEFKVEVSKEQVKQEIKLETPKEQVKQEPKVEAPKVEVEKKRIFSERITVGDCKEGEMKCSGKDGFNTCNFNKWVWRSCSVVTICKQLENSVICDYK